MTKSFNTGGIRSDFQFFPFFIIQGRKIAEIIITLDLLALYLNDYLFLLPNDVNARLYSSEALPSMHFCTSSLDSVVVLIAIDGTRILGRKCFRGNGTPVRSILYF